MADDDLDLEMRFHVNATELDRIRGAQDAVRRFNGEATTGFGKTARAAKDAEREMRDASNSAKTMAMGFASAATGASVSIGGMVALANQAVVAFNDAARAAASWETRMLEISTLGDFSSGQMGQMSDSLRDLAVRYGQLDQAVAKAQYDVMSSGFTDAAEALRLLDTSAKAAIGGVTDVATSAKLLTAIINAYGGGVENAAGISDVLFATVRDGVVTFEELAANLGNVTSTAATAGISFEEVAGAIALMTRKGIQAPEAVTALNGLIIALAAATPAAKAKLDELGITLDNGLAPALKAVNEASGQNLDILRELIPDMRALKAAASAGAGGAAELTAQIDALRHSAGAADIAYQKMSEGVEHAGNRLAAARARFKESIGSVGADTRGGLFNLAADEIDHLAKNADNFLIVGNYFDELIGTLASPGGALMLLGQTMKQASEYTNDLSGAMMEGSVFTSRHAESVAAINAQFRSMAAGGPAAAVNELSAAEKKAAENAAQLARELAALQPVAEGLGLATKELRVDMSGKIAWVNRTPDELARDINDTVQYAYESSQQPMIITPKVQVEMQGPLLGMSPQEIADHMKQFQDAGTRAMTMTEQGALSLATSIQGSLVNAIYDAKAKLIDIGSIGRSVFATLVGGLAALGIGALATAINPALGAVVGRGLGLKPKALGGATAGASIVGEYGPELFIPDSPGRIVPSDKLRGMRGGGNTTIDARTNVYLPASSVIFMHSRSAIRQLSEEVSRLQEEKISRTYSGGRR